MIMLVPGTLIVIVLFYVASFNRFVSQQTLVTEAWKQVDVELLRRFDLIPNLVETVKGYARHEQEALAGVVAARTEAQTNATGSPAHRQPFEAALGKSISGVVALAESYPDLKANTNFAQLQTELGYTEDRIAAARRVYNGNVRAYNTRTRTFPSNIIATIHHFKKAEFFELDNPAARNPANVQF